VSRLGRGFLGSGFLCALCAFVVKSSVIKLAARVARHFFRAQSRKKAALLSVHFGHDCDDFGILKSGIGQRASGIAYQRDGWSESSTPAAEGLEILKF
jgi:hypothetical protein